jgi:hypothetical protein
MLARFTFWEGRVDYSIELNCVGGWLREAGGIPIDNTFWKTHFVGHHLDAALGVSE